jgi:membrane protein required for colicin V production
VSILDLFIAAGLVIGVVRGLTTGAIRQVAGLVALVVVFFLSVQLMRPVGAWLAGALGLGEGIAPLVGFIVTFGVLYAVVLLLIHWLETVAGWLRLKSVNRLAGGLLGGFKAALLLSVLFITLAYVGVPGDESRRNSVFYDPVSSLLPVTWDAAASFLPDAQDFAARFEHHVNRWPFERDPNEE